MGGNRLLVFGDLERSIAMATFDIMSRAMEGTLALFRNVGSEMKTEEGG